MTEGITPRSWYDGTGTIAERTDVVINGILDWADKTDTDNVTRKNVADAVRQLTPVGGDETVERYVERITVHGPFTNETAGLWSIQWERVYQTGEYTNNTKGEAAHD